VTNYIEPFEELTEKDRNIHRALNSLKEEIDAVEWYHQRAAVTSDPEIKTILIHNLEEEIEHAGMILEWLRRNMSGWDEILKTYLFTTDAIVNIENQTDSKTGKAKDDLDIGSLKK